MPICADLEFFHPITKELISGISLCDTGNNFKNLVSKEFLEDHNISYLPVRLTAYAIDLTNVNIVGKLNIKFRFTGTNSFFYETFYVPERTSKVVNLGSEFLSKHKINVNLEKNELQFNNEIVPLNLTPKLNSKLIAELELNEIPQLGKLENLQDNEIPQGSGIPGMNFTGEGKSYDLDSQKFNLVLAEPVILYPGGSTVLVKGLQHKSEVNNWYVSPINSKQTGKIGIILLEGLYHPRDDGYCHINVINTNTKKITLLAGVKIGHGFRTIANTSCNKTINELEYDQTDTMTLMERISFIKKNLKLDENEIIAKDKGLKGKIIKLCLDNFSIFSLHETDIGSCPLFNYTIELEPDAKPIKARNIPLNPLYEKNLREQLDKWLKAGVIEEGMSSWSSPIFAVKKKPVQGGEAKLRFVIDYRGLNSVTKKVSWPLPLISENLARLGTGQIFSTFDLTQAYHSMHMDPESKEYTAFTAANRQYVFNRLPFGLANAPSIFCRLMDKCLSLLPDLHKYIIAYLDDLICYSKTTSEHLDHISKLFFTLKKAGLKLNLNKCEIFTQSCEYLGKIVSPEGLKMNPSYLERINQWSRPNTGKDLQRFMGFCNYYREFYPRYAELSHELDGHRNDKEIEWTASLNDCWVKFKDMFYKTICRGYPQWDNPNPFILDVDFSSHYFGGILSQIQNNQERIIAVTSKKCNMTEANYPAHKGELACLVYVMKQFLHFLRYRPFIIRTDSISLVHYKGWTKNSINGVTHRWLLYIQSFDFKVQHRKGKEHKNADNLSRGTFDCTKHQKADCTECISETTLDPYLDECPFLDQIFNLEYSAAPDSDHVTDTEAWVTEIQKDEILQTIRTWVIENRILSPSEKLEIGGRKEMLYNYSKHFYIFNGVVIFRQPLPENKYIDRPVVPLGLYNKIFDLAHAGVTGGHRGIQETIARINSIYFMPGVNKFVESRINNCISCLKKIGHVPKHNTIISHSTFNETVFGNVSIDLIGPLTQAHFQGETVKYILILVCLYSRYVFAHPIRDATAECTIKCILQNFVPVYGLFRAVKSDRGTNFSSKVFTGVLQELGIKAKVTPPRNPNSNPVERQNQSIYALLRTNDTYENKDWPKKLAYACLVINCSKSRRTGFTPYYLVFGRAPILPVNLFSPITSVSTEISSQNYLQFLKHIESVIKQISTKSKLYLEFQNKSRANKEDLFINDICFCFFNIVKINLSKKLQSFFTGPFVIKHKFSETLFEIMPFSNNPVKSNQVVSRDKLRKINSKTEIMGEVVSFNVYPLPEIVPSGEITIGLGTRNNKDTNVDFDEGDFTILSYENDSSLSTDDTDLDIGPDNTKDSLESTEVAVNTTKDNNDISSETTSSENLKDTMEESQQINENINEEIGDKTDHVPNNDNLPTQHLEMTLPSESSFLQSPPPQSSPEKDVVISNEKATTIPGFLDKRTTRSQAGGTHYSLNIKRAFSRSNKKGSN